MAAFLHVDLEQVAHVVERRCRLAQMALLLDRRRLSVALDHHETAQHGAILAGYILPDRLAEMATKRNGAVVLLWREQNAPAVFRHLHIVEFRPALGVHGHGCAQIDQRLLEAFGTHILPPVEIARVPTFERPQNATILREADIVGNLGRVVDVDEVHGMLLFLLVMLFMPVWCRIPACGRCRSETARRFRRSHSAAGISNSARQSGGQRFWFPWSPGRRSADWPPAPSGYRARSWHALRERGGFRPPNRYRRARR